MFAFELKSNMALDQISEEPFLCFCRFRLMGNQNYAFWITNTKCKGMSLYVCSCSCACEGVGVHVHAGVFASVCARVSEESSNAHIWILMYRNLHAAGFMSRGCCKYPKKWTRQRSRLSLRISFVACLDWFYELKCNVLLHNLQRIRPYGSFFGSDNVKNRWFSFPSTT